jgi:dienelactone hydrolase
MRHLALPALALVIACGFALADGPQDNLADKVRRIPPPGIELAAADRAELSDGVAALGKEIEDLRTDLKGKPALLELLPDVQIFHNAVRYALKYDEFYQKGEVAVARKLLEQGFDRARHLREGKSPWTTEAGLVVRGYRSKIDDSVQPYGLVVPATYKPDTPFQHRLDIWFHGRGEKLTELAFIDGRQKNPGEFTPPHVFVLHPYGRYCNANHFAGEVDTFEALEHVQKHYPIDENRIVVRGFSMGGAACWHMAVHHAWRWAAAAPGAGFAETPEFLRVFQNEELEPTWWEKKLWHLYDCTDWAINLRHCPTVAYSGELDSQKQAADIMARALDAKQIRLQHILGAGAKHSYTAAAKQEISRRIDRIASTGRELVPERITFTTWTLRYNRSHWIIIDGLDQHWEQASVTANIVARDRLALRSHVIGVYATSVKELTIAFDAGDCPLDSTLDPVDVQINRTVMRMDPIRSDRSLVAHFRRDGKEWVHVRAPDPDSLKKRHGLQGPIDDAFMDRFLMVRPTHGTPHKAVAEWFEGEMGHAVEHWRRQFRGEITPRDDRDVTDADIASSNLILWGDPPSNTILARIADKLPIKWDAGGVHLGDKTFDIGHHVPVLIYPNPLNPKKYVVLNSGFTFREYDYLNNARQVPKLPDWAILDVNQPPTSRRPAGIVEAGFFDEQWRLPATK